MNCQTCNEKLSKKEVNEIEKAKEESSYPSEIKWLCEECENDERNIDGYTLDYENYSDADNGL